jgi:exopolysaccharide production protein ExoQ
VSVAKQSLPTSREPADLGFSQRPPAQLWMQLSAAALILALLYGYGAFENLYRLHPQKYVALQLLLLVPALLLSPRASIRRIMLPIPFLLFVAWWMASYSWSSFRPAFLPRTADVLTNILVVLIFARVLPIGYFLRTIVNAGYLAIGLIFVTLVLKPHSAWSGVVALGDPEGGLQGGFIHKNFMAPCLIFTTVLVLCFERRRWLRSLMVVGTLLLLLLAKSATGQFTMVATLGLLWALLQYDYVAAVLKRSFNIVTVGLASVVLIAAFAVQDPILKVFNKNGSFSGRSLLWEAVVKAIKDRPWVGYGWGGTFTDFSRQPTLSFLRAIGYPVFHSHNGVLELLLRLGIVGLVLYLAQFASTMHLGWRLTKDDDPLGRATLLLGAITVLFAISESLTVLGVWYGLLCAFACLCRARIAGDESLRRPPRPERPERHARRAALAQPERRARPRVPMLDRRDPTAFDEAVYDQDAYDQDDYDQDDYEGRGGGSRSIGPL